MAPIQLRVRSFTPGLEKTSVSVDETTTEAVGTLLEALYPDSASAAGPAPKLFFKGRLLNGDASPSEVGVKTGCTLVAVPRRSLPPSKPANLGPVPDKATIDALTIAEAKSRGLPDEAPPSAVPKHPRFQSMEAHLMGALEDVHPALRAGLLSGGFHLGREEEEEEEEEGAVAADVEVPEPDVQGLVTLQEMGFSTGAARRALLLNRNRREDAVDWVLRHSSDPNLEVPLTPEELQQAWRPRRRRRQQPGTADPEGVQYLVEMGFDRDRSSSALIRARNDVPRACQMLLAEDTLREAAAAGDGNTAGSASGAAQGDSGATSRSANGAEPAGEPSVGLSRPEQAGGQQPDGGDAGMEASASSSSEYTTDDDAGADAHMMGASSEEGGDHMMGFVDGMTEDSGSDLDEYDMDDSDSNSDMDEMGGDMPPAAEDDYEVGLQDLPDADGGGPPHSISVGLSFGPDGEPFHAMVGLQDLISNHNDEQIIQEIQSSPIMIDAVQSLLAGGGAPLAHLSQHPEMATLVRRLRRIVGIETDGDETADMATPEPAAQSSSGASANPGSLNMLSQALVALASHANTPQTAGPGAAGVAAAAIFNSGAAGGGGPGGLLRRLSTAPRGRSLRAELADAAASAPSPAAADASASQQVLADAAAGRDTDGSASDGAPAAMTGSTSQQ